MKPCSLINETNVCRKKLGQFSDCSSRWKHQVVSKYTASYLQQQQFRLFFFNVSNKMRISQKCACTCIYDFPVTSIYVILQAAGLGYLIGGSIVVSDAAACKSASGKLNFWRHVINVQLPLTALSHTVLGVQLNSFSNRTTDDSFTSLPFYCNRMNFLYPLRGGWVGHRFDPDALD